MPIKPITIVVNEEDPNTGDFLYSFYDSTRPTLGDDAEIKRMKTALRGLSGKNLRVTFRGVRIDDEDRAQGKERGWRVSHTIRFRKYGDIFGKDGVLSDAMHKIRAAGSGDELVITHITIREATAKELAY